MAFKTPKPSDLNHPTFGFDAITTNYPLQKPGFNFGNTFGSSTANINPIFGFTFRANTENNAQSCFDANAKPLCDKHMQTTEFKEIHNNYTTLIKDYMYEKPIKNENLFKERMKIIISGEHRGYNGLRSIYQLDYIIRYLLYRDEYFNEYYKFN